MTVKFSSLVASVSFVVLCSASVAAYADGMPFAETKPQPNLAPIDKAIDAQTKSEEAKAPPVSVTPPPPEAAPAPAQAEAPIPPAPESRVVNVQPNTSFFGLSVGTYDRFTHSERATAFMGEWQPGVRIAGFLQPIFGAMGTTKGTLYGYAGIGVPINVTEHVFLMPSVAVGGYKKGDGYDLDRSVVYKAGTELAYQFNDKSRLGLNFHVLTNGTSLNRADRAEIVALTYTMPFDMFSRSSPTMNAQMQAPAVATPVAAAESEGAAQHAALIMPAAGSATFGSRPLPDVLP